MTIGDKGFIQRRGVESRTTNRTPSIAKSGTSGVQPPRPKRTSQEDWIRIRNPVRGKHGSLANPHELGNERDWVESLGFEPPFLLDCKWQYWQWQWLWLSTYLSSCSSMSFNVHRNWFDCRLFSRLRLCRRKLSLYKFYLSKNISQFPSSWLNNMASGWSFTAVRPCSSERLDERPRERLEGR